MVGEKYKTFMAGEKILSSVEPLTYKNVDVELVRFIPELQVSHQKCIHQYDDDSHPGQYIVFEGMFQCFIEILLNVQKETKEKERLLKRSYEFVEKMFVSSDEAVRDLAWIVMLENHAKWLYALSKDYFGPDTWAAITRLDDRWSDFVRPENAIRAERDYIDLYGVREVILNVLQIDGIGRLDIPGISYPENAKKIFVA